MAIVTLDFGSKVDMLNKSELAEALAEDARLRSILTGVKTVEQFYPTSVTGGASQVFTTGEGPPQSPSSGYVWAIMNVGLELAVTSPVRIYKGAPAFAGPGTFTASGNGRLIATASNSIVPSNAFSKGQFMIRAGDQMTFVASSASAFILSVFIVGIEVPAERIGELLL